MNPLRLGLLSGVLLLTAGCNQSKDVVLYVALDQEHSSALVRQFEEETGLSVKARYDTEANKTVGLVGSLVEEKDRPRADVFWNNELAHTVNLAGKGLFAPYAAPNGASIPAEWKDGEARWHGFAARARILIVNRTLLPDPKEWPRSTWDLVDPKWKGKCGLARPLTGTTLTHFAALQELLGEAKFASLLDGIFANDVTLLQSNGATMKAVSEGRLHWAWTDTDDYYVAITKGHPVAAVFPDQEDGGLGTMLLPNSVALVQGGPNPENGKRLVDWILAERTEALLAAAKSAQIPLRAGVKGPIDPDILPVGKFRAMAWDVAKTARNLEPASAAFATRF